MPGKTAGTGTGGAATPGKLDAVARPAPRPGVGALRLANGPPGAFVPMLPTGMLDILGTPGGGGDWARLSCGNPTKPDVGTDGAALPGGAQLAAGASTDPVLSTGPTDPIRGLGGAADP